MLAFDPALQPHPLHAAKLVLPGRPHGCLSRLRLLDFLHANIHCKLVSVSAAAGYGKTTLFSDFLHGAGFAAAWCRLDETDQDVTALAGDLVAALRCAFPAFPAEAAEIAARRGASPRQAAEALCQSMGAALDEFCILTLDDLHRIQDSAPAIVFLEALVEGLPEQVHLLANGRARFPARALYEAGAGRSRVATLDEADLRFTPAEVAALVRQNDQIELSEAEAERLAAESEGWITGLLLTARLLARRAPRPAGRRVYEYLAAEVLQQQSEALQQFLCESAVLPEMEAAVCDEVLGRADSAAMLGQVEARRLFVSAAGDEFRTYQYHHLFREFLAGVLQARDAPRLRQLQARAAEWYAANDMPEAAVTYFSLAGLPERGAAVAEARAREMFRLGRRATLRRWAEQLRPVQQAAPWLYLNAAKTSMDLDNLPQAAAELEIAADGFAQRPDAAEGRLEVDVFRGLLMYRRGEPEAGLRLAQSVVEQAGVQGLVFVEAMAWRVVGLCRLALRQLEAAEAAFLRAVDLYRRVSTGFDLAILLDDLAVTLRARGQTARAAQAQQESLALWRRLAVPGPLANTLNNVAWDMHMLGQYPAARALYLEALAWARRSGSARLEMHLQCGLADLLADAGERGAAADLYRQALLLAEKTEEKSVLVMVFRGLARLERAAGNLAGALEWLRRAALAASDQSPYLSAGALESLRGMILVEMGQAEAGLQVIRDACAQLEQAGAQGLLAPALLFRAHAEHCAGARPAAMDSLRQALRLCHDIGYDQPLVREALSVRELLKAALSEPDLARQIDALLSRAERSGLQYASASAAPALSPPALSVRALGAGVVMKDGREIPRTAWASQRTRELFYFLADRMPIARDQVLLLFWPDMPPDRASANFYQTLYRLRRATGYELVLLEGQICRLSPEVKLEYDVAAYQAAAREALALPVGSLRRPADLGEALALYSGEYLADLPVDWAAGRRRELADLFVDLSGAYAGELIGHARYAEARRALEKALAADPLRDDLHHHMLLSLDGLGRRHEVVEHYRRYRELLRSELGLDPPAEIRALYARLIA